MVFDIRLRLFTPAGVKGRVLKTLSIEWTGPESGSPTVRFSVSSRVAGYLTAPLVVGVEYSVDGGNWTTPRNDLFIAEEEDADSEDQTQTVNFVGTGLVSWLLSRTYLHWSPSARNQERDWVQFQEGVTGTVATYKALPSGLGSGDKGKTYQVTADSLVYEWDGVKFPAEGQGRYRTGSATPGHMLNGMLVESQARGWGPHITWDFTALKDSLGNNWPLAGDKLWWEPWRLLTPISTVLAQVSDAGFCEWWTEGLTLRMSVPGAGVNRSDEVVLGGAGFTNAPGKASFKGVFTHLTVVPEKARHWLYLDNPGADSSFGRLEATMTQSGVESHARATVLAQPALTSGRNLLREQSFQWTPSKLTRLPFHHFNVGDEVTVRTRNGKAVQRVIGLVVEKRAEQVKVRAVTGHKLLGTTIKQLNRIGQATMGGVVGGTGAAFPAAQRPPSMEPAAPTGLAVTSNTAVWAEDWSGLATIGLSWNAVTQTTEGNVIDISEYEVWEREGDDVRRVTAALHPASSVHVTSGESRSWMVRARSRDGVWSDFSAEVSATAVMPASVIPKAPTGLAVVSNVGAFQQDGTAVSTVTVSWTPVTESTDDVPLDVAEYEVRVGQETVRVATAPATFTVSSGRSVSVTVRARTPLNVWGDPSAALPVTGAIPALNIPTPTGLTVTGGPRTVVVEWAGTWSGPAGHGVAGVFAETSFDGVTWVRVTGPVASAGGHVGQLSGEPGDTVQVRLRGVDTLGRVGTASTVESGTFEGISIADIPGLEGDLDDIRFTADGKNNIFVKHLEPAGVTPGDLWFQVNEDETWAETVNVWDGTGWVRQVLYADSVFAANSVTSALIRAGAIEVSHLSAPLGNMVISASESVTILAGDLEEQRLFFRVDGDAAKIGRQDSVNEVRIAPERIEMTQNGVAELWLEGGVVNANQAILDSAVIGNHKLEKYGSGRTIGRPL